MGKNEFLISSTSIDEFTGNAQIIIEGQLIVPDKCDNPIIELFRPVRNKYREEMFFVVTTIYKEGSIICCLFPSNTRGRKLEEFLKTANAVLEGDSENKGMILDYVDILERFFEDKDGLDAYLATLKKAETADESKKYALYAHCNEQIKTFVNKIGLTMPSFKKPAKPKKTKAQKRADSKAYQAAHPECRTKND